MGDLSNSETQKIQTIIGSPKSATLKDMCKSYKSVVMKWHPDHKHPSNKAEDKFGFIKETFRALSIKKREEESIIFNTGNDHEPKTPMTKKSIHKKNNDNVDYEKEEEEELHISSPKLLSRTTSRISQTSRIPSLKDFHASFQETLLTSTPPTPTTPKGLNFLTKSATGRIPATPIFFSQSAVRRKPEPIEKKLQCTLEELCLGCVKKITITRDAILSSGYIIQEEETLLIKVKPGWKKGTKIIFEAKGDERPGTLPADIIFAIDEKKHPIFERDGDDLELGVEVPLVQALTGCTICVPLLGGGQMTLSIEDIIYPGYKKIIPGQGMPKSKEEGRRGDLRLRFLVKFPDELNDEQKSEVVRILEECS